ncbi:organoarsenical effux MFS transporter ArsJ [Azospirillum sp.]|uniref:organoarsenical effux MFS transporter ArsJ n=1 Tax=Azospirillum sp. TaxID=34012 RepID=UPI002D2B65F9|nr:organoarsenical effux MFS transporter ArsJ [Azospirillum sp.]HYD70274.1 organoarsenical effux MFS transporter ArsJ [Azospirillum sp.]
MSDLRNYAIVTAAYWGFTLTDGALRMLVLLHFNALGYTPFQLAFLFVLYEFFGVVTNLLGGWIGSRLGLTVTLFAGLALQVAALLMLSAVDPGWTMALSVAWVVAAQGLAGIAKDLTKMSSKSAIKLVVPEDKSSTLFRWVALLTGSKNTLKGVGFFLGGLLLATLGFAGALWAMAGALALVLLACATLLKGDFGRSKAKVKFTQLLSKTPAVNRMAAARFFLFGARDVWFVVGVPVFLASQLGWGFAEVGGFLAAWVIGYGVVQAAAPAFVRHSPDGVSGEVRAARLWALILAAIPAGLAAALAWGADPALSVIAGLGLFGVAFAVNSSIHSYLILAYTDADTVAVNVGFYYMANAGGRLMGSLLSGLSYQVAGIAGCLLTAAALVAASFLIALFLPTGTAERRLPA